MIELTFREISILDVLLNKEFVDAKELMQSCDISHRTLHAEINLINDILAREPHEIQILNQRGKGYFLDYSIDSITWIEKLKRHCKDYLNVTLNKRFSDNLRVPFICRQLFVNQTYTKIEDLALSLNVSTATVNKDMRAVREFLQLYHLSVQSTPYYGMIIVGDELAIRSCMIDLLDIYSYSTETIFFELSFKQYGLNKQQFMQIMEHVNQVIIEGEYQITDTGFRRLIKYLLVAPMREKHQLALSETEREAIAQLDEYQLAQLLVEDTMAQEELEMLTLFILANSEIDRFAQNKQLTVLLPDVPQLQAQIFGVLAKRYNLELKQYPDLARFLLRFLYKFQLRKKYHFIELEVLRTNKHIIRKFPSSIALATYIYFEIPNGDESDFYDRLFFDFVMNLYNLVCRVQNDYYPTHIIIVNDNGKIANETLLRKFNFDNFNVHYHFHYMYELDKLDHSNYDYLFISEGFNFDISQIPIPTLTFDFFLNADFTSLIWQQIFSVKRKIGAVINYLTDPLIIEIDGTREQVIEQIVEHLTHFSDYRHGMSLDKFKRFIRIMIFNADYSNHLMTKYITLFTKQSKHNKYVIFRLKQPIKIKHRYVNNLQFIFLDVSKGILEIKNGDSELRRFFKN